MSPDAKILNKEFMNQGQSLLSLPNPSCTQEVTLHELGDKGSVVGKQEAWEWFLIFLYEGLLENQR